MRATQLYYNCITTVLYNYLQLYQHVRVHLYTCTPVHVYTCTPVHLPPKLLHQQHSVFCPTLRDLKLRRWWAVLYFTNYDLLLNLWMINNPSFSFWGLALYIPPNIYPLIYVKGHIRAPALTAVHAFDHDLLAHPLPGLPLNYRPSPFTSKRTTLQVQQTFTNIF